MIFPFWFLHAHNRTSLSSKPVFTPHSILQQVLYQPYGSWLGKWVQPARGQDTKAGDSAKVQKDKAPLWMKKTKSSLD